MARLKVFAARMGFFETVVAAPSRKAALEAWGTKQNLFAEGMAAPVDDPDTVAAAMAHPGVVLRRSLGSKGDFEEDASARAIPSRRAGRTVRAKRPPDRSKLTAAEMAVAASQARFAKERAELQGRLDHLSAAEAQETAQLEEALRRAMAAWRLAGGKA